MPQEWPTTFSPGQAVKDENAGTTPVTQKPIYDFSVRKASLQAASQLSSAVSTFSFSQPPVELASVTDIPNSQIPGGVRVPPRLKVAVAGKASKLKERQRWTGTVTQVIDGGFIAVLRDSTDPRNPDEQATFENAEISTDDLDLIRPGSSFYWIIGSLQTHANQVINASIVQFRRLPPWTQRALKRADQRADRLRNLFHE